MPPPRELSLRRSDGSPLRGTVSGDPAGGRLAAVLPGALYTPAHPLLYYARAALLEAGFAVAEAWWQEPAGQAGEGAVAALSARLADDAEALLASAGGDPGELLLVGKSLGTLAMAELVQQRGLRARGVWLTPLLGEASVAAAIEQAGGDALLVLGSADPARDEAVVARARAAGAAVVEIEGADHGLELSAPLRSLDALRRSTVAIADFARGPQVPAPSPRS